MSHCVCSRNTRFLDNQRKIDGLWNTEPPRNRTQSRCPCPLFVGNCSGWPKCHDSFVDWTCTYLQVELGKLITWPLQSSRQNFKARTTGAKNTPNILPNRWFSLSCCIALPQGLAWLGQETLLRLLGRAKHLRWLEYPDPNFVTSLKKKDKKGQTQK